MKFFKAISHLKNLKNYLFIFLMFFLINNQYIAEAHENKYLLRSIEGENKLKEFYSENQITYSQHDNLNNQLKLFFGFDYENPGLSYYPDSLIIRDSDYIRDIYKLKLRDMTLIK